jgi:hypothetical protein
MESYRIKAERQGGRYDTYMAELEITVDNGKIVEVKEVPRE